LINNVTLLAKVAKEFNVPAVITAVETESFSGYVWPQLLDVFPGQPVVERTSMNSWDDMGFRKAIEATGKKEHHHGQLTWIAVWPVSMLVPAILTPLFGPHFPQVLGAGIVAAGIVVILTWVAMPLLVKVAHPWLYP
jgi:nicotinamidase-related amidase